MVETKAKASDKSEGYGKILFMKKNNLLEEEFQACLQAGEIHSWRAGGRNGIMMYAATHEVHERSSSRSSKNLMVTQDVDLTRDAGLAFHKVFAGLQPEVKMLETKGKNVAKTPIVDGKPRCLILS